MTKEQAIKELRISECYSVIPSVEALDMAIKALEQQPCEDCVSRQAVIDLINADWKYEGLELSINELPPVTPTRKVGKWINSVYSVGFTCTCCLLTQASSFKYNFCPNCGADMRGAKND